MGLYLSLFWVTCSSSSRFSVQGFVEAGCSGAKNVAFGALRKSRARGGGGAAATEDRAVQCYSSEEEQERPGPGRTSQPPPYWLPISGHASELVPPPRGDAQGNPTAWNLLPYSHVGKRQVNAWTTFDYCPTAWDTLKSFLRQRLKPEAYTLFTRYAHETQSTLLPRGGGT